MNTMDRVLELAEGRNMSLYQLAKVSDVPYSTIKAARQRGNQLTVETLYRLCQGLGVTMGEFFKETEESNVREIPVREIVCSC